MNYASANRRLNPAAMAGALGIPGAFGALLVVGLAVTVVTVPEPPRPEARDVTDVPLPPPPPPTPDATRDNTTPTTTPANPTTSPPVSDLRPLDLGGDNPIDTLPGLGDAIGSGPIDTGLPVISPSIPAFDAVGARAKGDPGRWVTNDDYRPRWIREDMAGTARFTLAIDAAGRVTGCTITRSTGHAPLDTATCELVTKRARFDAARDTTGRPVAGSYKGSITWEIP